MIPSQQEVKAALPAPGAPVLSQETDQNWCGLTIYAFYKMRSFPLSVHILQKLYFFLSVPTMWKRKKKVAKGWFPTPFLHLRWGSDFPQTVPWDSSENSRTEGADFREVTAPPLRNLRRPGDPEVTAIQWGCGVLIGTRLLDGMHCLSSQEC